VLLPLKWEPDSVRAVKGALAKECASCEGGRSGHTQSSGVDGGSYRRGAAAT
jgi:hypothetical protein